MYQTIKDQENRDKCSGDNYKNKYHKYFARMTETSWKGEKQTLDCLEKIMDKEKDYLVVKGSIQSGKSSLMIYYSAWNADNSDDTADKNKMGHLNLKIFLSLNYFITCFIVQINL